MQIRNSVYIAIKSSRRKIISTGVAELIISISIAILACGGVVARETHMPKAVKHKSTQLKERKMLKKMNK